MGLGSILRSSDNLYDREFGSHVEQFFTVPGTQAVHGFQDAPQILGQVPNHCSKQKALPSFLFAPQDGERPPFGTIVLERKSTLPLGTPCTRAPI